MAQDRARVRALRSAHGAAARWSAIGVIAGSIARQPPTATARARTGNPQPYASR